MQLSSGRRPRWIPLCFRARPANAHSTGRQHAGLTLEEVGRLTLPFETQWGPVVLPAGNCSFTIQSATDSSLIEVRNAQGQPVMITSSYGVSEGKLSDASLLIVLRSGGKGTVRSLYLRELGMTFYYPRPKGEKQFVAQAPELLQRVPVSVSGK